MRNNTPRNGATKVDVLVVFGIVVLVIACLAPAVEVARESARKSTCRHHMMQIGQAITSYHDTFAILPPAAFWESGELVIDHIRLIGTERDRTAFNATRQNWAQLILPFLGKNELARSFDPVASIMSPENELARRTPCEVMNCPSDPFSTNANEYTFIGADGSEKKCARGNYGINGGSHISHQFPGYLSNPVPNGTHCAFDSESGLFQIWGSGVAGFNKCFSFSDFTNSLATTVLVDEIRAGIDEGDPRGVWALGQIGSSVTSAHGINGDAAGPNCPLKHSDDILDGHDLYKQIGAARITEEEMPFCDHCKQPNQATSRSKHPGGVNVLLADGAVRYVSNRIDVGLWHVMHSRETPRDVFDDGFVSKIGGPSVVTKEAARRPEHIIPPARTASSTLVNSIGMKFIVVPAGEFVMGLPNKGNRRPYPDGATPHNVRITNPFYLGVCEVTQGQYLTVTGKNPNWLTASNANVATDDPRNYPIRSVTWNEAIDFCQMLSHLEEERAARRSYRLPTEAEWEYASRAGKQAPYSFQPKWVDGDLSGIIAGKEWIPRQSPIVPVASYPANDFGLHDMCGNVFEWASDWYQPGYYETSPFEDPQGPSSGNFKIVRGWYWRYVSDQCHYEYMITAPWQSSSFIGFRVVCETLGES